MSSRAAGSQDHRHGRDGIRDGIVVRRVASGCAVWLALFAAPALAQMTTWDGGAVTSGTGVWQATPYAAGDANWVGDVLPTSTGTAVFASGYSGATITDAFLPPFSGQTGFPQVSVSAILFTSGAAAYTFNINSVNFGTQVNGGGIFVDSGVTTNQTFAGSPGASPPSPGLRLGGLGSSATVRNNGTGLLAIDVGYTAGQVINGPYQVTLTFDGSGDIRMGMIRDRSTPGDVTSVVKNGGGTLTIIAGAAAAPASDSGWYRGGTTINAGRVNVNAATALGGGGLVINSGTLGNTSGAAVTLSTNNAQTWAGDFAFAGSNDLNLGTGAVSLGSATRTVTVSSNVLTVGGVIGGSGGLTKAGSGTLTLSAANTYTGTTTIGAGRLQIGSGSTTGGLSASSVITGSTGATLAFNRTDNYGGAFANTIGGGLGLVLDSGTLTLSAANTYSGATTIAGTNTTLVLGSAGSFANSQTIRVGNAGSSGAILDLTSKTGTFAFTSGQTVGGIGTINIGSGKTVSSAGLWAPGNSIGSNAVTGNLSLSGTSQFELGTPGTSTTNPGTSDFTAVSGTLTLGGALSLIDNAGADGNGSAAGGVYRLFTYGAVSGSYASVTANPTATTRTSLGNISYGGSGTAAGQGVFLSVYNLAAGSVASGTTVSFGTVLKGTSLSQALSITNTAPGGSFTEGLDAAFGTLGGGATTNGGSISLLAGGSTSTAMTVGLGSATAGAKIGSAVVNYTSDGAGTSGLGEVGVGSQTVNLSATVLDPAVASFGSGPTALTTLTLDFLTVNQGDTVSPQNFSLYNLLQTAGFTADLALLSINQSNPTGPFSTNLSLFNSLASGTFNSYQASVNTSNQGTFTNTWTLEFKSANGNTPYSADTSQFLTLTANVIIVPEPAAIALAGIGIAAAAYALRRRKSLP